MKDVVKSEWMAERENELAASTEGGHWTSRAALPRKAVGKSPRLLLMHEILLGSSCFTLV